MIDFERLRFLYTVLPSEIARANEKAFAVERARSKAEKCTTVITGMPHGTGTHSQTEDGAIRVMEVEDAYREALDELNTMRAELEPLIEELPIHLKAVMRLRYLKGYVDAEISQMIGKSETTVERYRRDAQAIIEKRVRGEQDEVD